MFDNKVWFVDGASCESLIKIAPGWGDILTGYPQRIVRAAQGLVTCASASIGIDRGGADISRYQQRARVLLLQ
jgi:hypothetical protein